MLVVLSLLFLVVGCGTPKVQKDFETMLKVLQNGDTEKIKQLNPQSDIADDSESIKIFLDGYKKMTYKIKNTKVEGDTATINLDLKAPDLTGYFPEYMQKIMALAFANLGKSGEEMKKLGEEFVVEFFGEKLNSKDLKYNEKNIDVIFKKNGEKWEIDSENEKNKPFFEIISFGFSKLMESFEGNLTQGEGTNKQLQENKKIAITELLKTEKVEFTVLKKEISKKVSDNDYTYYKPDSENNSFIILTIKVKNISNKMLKLDNSGFQLFLHDNQYSPSTLMVKDSLDYQSINPGTEITKKVFYDVPDDVAKSEGLVLKTVDNIFSETGEVEVNLK
ncbi:MAG: DUF4352 domain-containing protein [Leptotrichiaceae bacterium]|nr:DUF4352 domain-containing protein [Leptotrichiaceae bacterium]